MLKLTPAQHTQETQDDKSWKTYKLTSTASESHQVMDSPLTYSDHIWQSEGYPEGATWFHFCDERWLPWTGKQIIEVDSHSNSQDWLDSDSSNAEYDVKFFHSCKKVQYSLSENGNHFLSIHTMESVNILLPLPTGLEQDLNYPIFNLLLYSVLWAKFGLLPPGCDIEITIHIYSIHGTIYYYKNSCVVTVSII